jgi:hypothetical protein
MQDDSQRRGNMDKLAAHLHVVARARPRTKVSADFAVDGDATRRNQFIAMPARSNFRGSEEAVEAHSRNSLIVNRRADLTM